VGVCNQISFLVPYYNSSSLVTLLEVVNALIQVPENVDLNIFNRETPIAVLKGKFIAVKEVSNT
jgi:hypothetical protein